MHKPLTSDIDHFCQLISSQLDDTAQAAMREVAAPNTPFGATEKERAASASGLGLGGVGVGVRQRDLIIAGEAEVAKMQGGNFDIISKLFT